MAKWLGWVDNQMRPRPERGRRSVESVVSHLPKTRAALVTSSAELHARAQARLEALPKERTGRSQVRSEKRQLDHIVYLAEGEHGKGGSMGIEMRHGILSGAVKGMMR